MDGALLLAFEAGYNALPGVMAQDITSWGEMKQVYRELKKTEIKEAYKCIICDTIDIAADMCKKYICAQNGIEDLGELGFGKGWTKFKDEFNSVFRGLTQLGYAVIFLGHDKETFEPQTDGTNKIYVRPALSNSTKTVIAGMADIFGYAHQKYSGQNSVLTLRCSDGSIECGGRFKYIPDEIPMSYDNLVEAIHTAIDKEAAEHDGQFVTNEKIKAIETHTYDFKALYSEFQELVTNILQDESKAPLITAIVDKYLGKGKKVSDATPEQAEFIYLINDELKTL